jgi:hypothetical protein
MTFFEDVDVAELFRARALDLGDAIAAGDTLALAEFERIFARDPGIAFAILSACGWITDIKPSVQAWLEEVRTLRSKSTVVPFPAARAGRTGVISGRPTQETALPDGPS